MELGVEQEHFVFFLTKPFLQPIQKCPKRDKDHHMS